MHVSPPVLVDCHFYDLLKKNNNELHIGCQARLLVMLTRLEAKLGLSATITLQKNVYGYFSRWVTCAIKQLPKISLMNERRAIGRKL